MKRSFFALIALVMFALVAPLAAPASASGDDYPYRYDTVNRADHWGFTTRQCVSFAAWRLAQYGHPINNGTQHWGNALNWDNNAIDRHIPVSSRPKIGAIAQWNAYEKSAYYPSTGGVGSIKAGAVGHVAWVRYVYGDGSVKIEQYNIFGNRAYSTMRVKAPRYIYLGG